ncbi:MAG: NAD(P)/FAD-dependent oxidoreductase [Bernardetiaceae bacterium]
MKKKHVVVIGGGAGGCFAAIRAKELHPNYQVTVLEKSQELLQKVRISGGGRCNVTHACYDPDLLVEHYPRGGRYLLGGFYQFQPADMIAWLEEHGVALKTEADGRIFPVSDQSETIINCFMSRMHAHGIRYQLEAAVVDLQPPTSSDQGWMIALRNGQYLTADLVLVATGSSPQMWKILQRLGYQVTPPVPSLFTFICADERLQGLAGISLVVEASVVGEALSEVGPLLITHRGLSAPAILRLSAWGARVLHARRYRFTLKINFLPDHSEERLLADLKACQRNLSKKQLHSHRYQNLPGRLWKRLLLFAGIPEGQRWADLSKTQQQALAQTLVSARFEITGKNTFKDEFVTCGGLSLDEIDLRRMESKRHPGLFFSGEVMDVDAITGGFNFQHAWTSATIAATNF